MALRTTQQHVSVLAPGSGSLRTTQQHVSVLAPGDGNLRTTQQHISVLAPGDGNLRVTNQYVEVIGRVSGSIRVTNQYIEILAQVNPQGVSDIGISHGVTFLREQTFAVTSDIGISQGLFISPYVVSIVSDIGIEHSSYQPIILPPDVEHTIGIGQSVAYTVKYDIYAVESNINFIQFADTPGHGRSGSSSLSLSHSAIGIRETILRPHVISTIEFGQSVGRGGSFHTEAFSNLEKGRLELRYTYDDDGNVTGLEEIWVQTGLVQEVSISGDYNDFDDGHHIGITDTVSYILTPAGGTSESVETTISWSHSVLDSLGVDSNIIITQIAIGLESTGADHSEIDVSHSVSYSISGERENTHTIGISHGVSYYVVEDAFCDYRINIGSTTETGLPSEPSQPTITEADQISFGFPAAAPSTTLYFGKPEWGNIHEVYQRRIDRKSRGGKRIIYHDSTWRQHEIIKITLTGLTEAQTMNLLTFFNNSAGDRVKYIDHESREWEVVILNPDEQIVRDGNVCDNTVSIEMETI